MDNSEKMKKLLEEMTNFLVDCCATTMSRKQPISPMSPNPEIRTVGEVIDEAKVLLSQGGYCPACGDSGKLGDGCPTCPGFVYAPINWRAFYDEGNCPACGELITANAWGDKCQNCGHVLQNWSTE